MTLRIRRPRSSGVCAPSEMTISGWLVDGPSLRFAREEGGVCVGESVRALPGARLWQGLIIAHSAIRRGYGKARAGSRIEGSGFFVCKLIDKSRFYSTTFGVRIWSSGLILQVPQVNHLSQPFLIV